MEPQHIGTHCVGTKHGKEGGLPSGVVIVIAFIVLAPFLAHLI
jgi:hypothetical protein